MLWMQVFQMMCDGIGNKFERSGTKWKISMKQRRKRLK